MGMWDHWEKAIICVGVRRGWWAEMGGWVNCNGWNGINRTIPKRHVFESVPSIPFQTLWLASPPISLPTSLLWEVYCFVYSFSWSKELAVSLQGRLVSSSREKTPKPQQPGIMGSWISRLLFSGFNKTLLCSEATPARQARTHYPGLCSLEQARENIYKCFAMENKYECFLD